jgi:lysophospholipase L1-like esterase
MTGPSRVLIILCFTLLGSAALLVGAEAAYRFRTARQQGVQVRFYRHARLERAMVRDTDYRGVVHINREGFRGTDVETAKAAGTTRIMVVGASTTFDPCATRDSETWPERLEYWLGVMAPNRRFEVINAGVSGLSMLGHLIRLQTELHAFDPDVIVVYAGHGIVTSADAYVNDEGASRTPDAAPIVTPLDRWLRRHSRLYERVRPAREPAGLVVELDDRQWEQAVDNAARRFERDLTSFTMIARSLGAKVVFAEINRVTGSRTPAQFTATERGAWRMFATPPEIVLAGYRRFSNVWRTVADSTDATFVPADSIAITGSDNFCDGDPIHFSTAGSEAMGRRMANQLLGHGVIAR